MEFTQMKITTLFAHESKFLNFREVTPLHQLHHFPCLARKDQESEKRNRKASRTRKEEQRGSTIIIQLMIVSHLQTLEIDLKKPMVIFSIAVEYTNSDGTRIQQSLALGASGGSKGSAATISAPDGSSSQKLDYPLVIDSDKDLIFIINHTLRSKSCKRKDDGKGEGRWVAKWSPLFEDVKEASLTISLVQGGSTAKLETMCKALRFVQNELLTDEQATALHSALGEVAARIGATVLSPSAQPATTTDKSEAKSEQLLCYTNSLRKLGMQQGNTVHINFACTQAVRATPWMAS